MKCSVKEEQLLSYSLNELSRSEKEIVEKHLMTCTHCQNLLEEMREWQQAWMEPTPHAFSDHFVDEIMNQIDETKTSEIHKRINHSSKKNRTQSMINVFVALAASFVLIFTGVFSSMGQHVANASNAFNESTQHVQEASGVGLSWLDQTNQQIHQVIDMFNFKKVER